MLGTPPTLALSQDQTLQLYALLRVHYEFDWQIGIGPSRSASCFKDPFLSSPREKKLSSESNLLCYQPFDCQKRRPDNIGLLGFNVKQKKKIFFDSLVFDFQGFITYFPRKVKPLESLKGLKWRDRESPKRGTGGRKAICTLLAYPLPPLFYRGAGGDFLVKAG